MRLFLWGVVILKISGGGMMVLENKHPSKSSVWALSSTMVSGDNTKTLEIVYVLLFMSGSL